MSLVRAVTSWRKTVLTLSPCAVIHEPMSTEPPSTSQCPHKFLILATLIGRDDDAKSLQEIVRHISCTKLI